MKAAKICPLIFLSVLGVLCFPLETQARPISRPRSHRCTVVVESVNVTNHTIHATSIGGHSKPLTLFWNKNTRFYIDAKGISPTDLRIGQKAYVVHRQPFIGPWRLERLFAAP
jgi:hypothetical protein